MLVIYPTFSNVSDSGGAPVVAVVTGPALVRPIDITSPALKVITMVIEDSPPPAGVEDAAVCLQKWLQAVG